MNYLTTDQIRTIWIEFWKEKGHEYVENKSLVPVDDPSLLFINSGVATIKKFLSGEVITPNKRLVNSQRSLRTNDIENVGITARHHTLFEMLGNFSIGDYFKIEVIPWAWELLTDPKYYNFDPEKLYITVHPDDKETVKIWKEVGVDSSHIIMTEDNFWEIGKGPGGPNTEIFFDRGIEYDDREISLLLEQDLENDRVVEIWNIVFSQYNCNPEIERSQYPELPQKNIDTGMGLERMACVIQKVATNYETDNFKKILLEISKVTNTKYEGNEKAYRIIADHIRALTFAISDKVLPSNEGRGYVIRRILRRAVKYGFLNLEIKEPFLYKLVPCVVLIMGENAPELRNNQENIIQVIKQEELNFARTLKAGIGHFETLISSLPQGEVISGEKIFKLYDTYGFPMELTVELIEEKNQLFELEGFYQALDNQKQTARNARAKTTGFGEQELLLDEQEISSEFVGYQQTEVLAEVRLINVNNQNVQRLQKEETGLIIFDKTPFYATSGGQTCDLYIGDDFEVLDVTKSPTGTHLHKIIAHKEIVIGEKLKLQIDKKSRFMISSNHSATHLLHQALEEVLGDNIAQAGSLQDEQRTRFDYTTFSVPTTEELVEIQALVNQRIKASIDVVTTEMNLDAAIKKGAKALFSEKYQDIVRVVEIGDSIELCGGTHVENTRQLESFLIISEQSISSGVRRIEAICGENIDKYINHKQLEFQSLKKSAMKKMDNSIQVSLEGLEKIEAKVKDYEIVLTDQTSNFSEEIQTFISECQDYNECLKDQNNSLKNKLIEQIVASECSKVIEFEGVKKLHVKIDNIDPSLLKELGDRLLEKLGTGIVIVELTNAEKLSVIIKVSDDLTRAYHAGKMIKELLEPLNGRGGGKPSMAQGGATISN